MAYNEPEMNSSGAVEIENDLRQSRNNAISIKLNVGVFYISSAIL